MRYCRKTIRAPIPEVQGASLVARECCQVWREIPETCMKGVRGFLERPNLDFLSNVALVDYMVKMHVCTRGREGSK